jgi:hypothetical protein
VIRATSSRHARILKNTAADALLRAQPPPPLLLLPQKYRNRLSQQQPAAMQRLMEGFPWSVRVISPVTHRHVFMSSSAASINALMCSFLQSSRFLCQCPVDIALHSAQNFFL